MEVVTSEDTKNIPIGWQGYEIYMFDARSSNIFEDLYKAPSLFEIKKLLEPSNYVKEIKSFNRLQKKTFSILDVNLNSISLTTTLNNNLKLSKQKYIYVKISKLDGTNLSYRELNYICFTFDVRNPLDLPLTELIKYPGLLNKLQHSL